MPKRQDHMLEALRASVGESSKPVPVGQNPALRRGVGEDLQVDSSQGAVPASRRHAAAESLGGIVPPEFSRVSAPPAPAPSPITANSPQARQVVLPLGLGTFLFVALFLLALSFGFGWLLAGGTNPWDQSPVGGSGVTSAALGTQPGGVVPTTSPASPSMRTDFAAFEDPRPLTVRESNRGSTEPLPVATPQVLGPDKALLDPVNHYTVQVVEYADQRETFQNYARATYDTLIRAGLPAVQPLLTDGKILLVVGAGKTASELKDLVRRLEQVPNRRGSGRLLPDPYVVPIHRVLP